MKRLEENFETFSTIVNKVGYLEIPQRCIPFFGTKQRKFHQLKELEPEYKKKRDLVVTEAKLKLSKKFQTELRIVPESLHIAPPTLATGEEEESRNAAMTTKENKLSESRAKKIIETSTSNSPSSCRIRNENEEEVEAVAHINYPNNTSTSGTGEDNALIQNISENESTLLEEENGEEASDNESCRTVEEPPTEENIHNSFVQVLQFFTTLQDSQQVRL